MGTTESAAGPIDDEWIEHHFDHLSPTFARDLHPTLAQTIDPPPQREFRRLINAHFRPDVVSEWERPTRDLVNRLIDGFVETGECDFTAAFARPLPGLAFFDMALHAFTPGSPTSVSP